ncbi:MAG: transglycosylase domain-containing protein [Rubrobacteraceae bacterium]
MARTYQRRYKDRRTTDPRKPVAGRSVRISGGSSSKRGRGLGTRILKGFGVFLLCCLVAAVGLTVGAYLGLVKSVSELEEPKALSTHPTYIYSAPLGDSDGSRRVIGTIFQGENRKMAEEDAMPASLLNALVAKEDERFREHGGVDLWGIMRALYVDLQEGQAVEGASTITQQYVKNAYLTQERLLSRKLKEAFIAIELERRIPKDAIIAKYLNTVYFGNNAYGVEAASETYFNKTTEDLTIAESATLVGVLNSPSNYAQDRDAAGQQRDLVLQKMFEAGYINEQEQQEALDEPLPEKWPVAAVIETGLTGPQLTRNFTELVQDELIQKYGAETVQQGGLNVYTTLELEKQVEAQDTIYGPNGYLPTEDYPDAALVSIEPKTGKIRAMVGNRDQNSHFNLVTQARRQPGSSFKPFALIAALEQGIDPTTEFVSEDKIYDVDVGPGEPEKWKVKNYEKEERGSISLEEALWQSDNTVFTDLVMNVDDRGLKNGPEAIVDVAKRLGVSAEFPDQPHPSVVLGAQEVSPMDMAVAYNTIANEGVRVEPTAIYEVVRNEGTPEEEVLQPPKPAKSERVISEEIARDATEIIMGDITNGIAGKAALGDRPVAGKTGTSERFFDAWFVGFTPQLTTGIWSGYSEGGQTLESLLGPEAQQLGTTPSPTIMFHDYMMLALEGEPIEKFEGVEAPAPTPTEDPSTQTGVEPVADTDAAPVDPSVPVDPTVPVEPVVQAEPVATTP